MKNPYTMTFGKEPGQVITRLEGKSEIIESFCSENPFSYAYIIEGLRGSGKTVLLSNIAKEFASLEDWIVIEVNPERDIYGAIANRLCQISEIKALFLKAKINISLFGVGSEIESGIEISDEEVILELMLKQLKSIDKKLLIVIDEATSNKLMRQFCLSFQMFIRNDLDIFLLMTGLYKNIYELQNEKNLTFLLRTPKIRLTPLSLIDIKNKYLEVLPVDTDSAVKMAKMTKGFSFAFQVLGYLVWNQGKKVDLKDIVPEYDRYLRTYIYDKLYSGLSDLEVRILKMIPDDDAIELKEIKEALELKGSLASNYKKRLIDKGLIDSPGNGVVAQVLPRFGAYLEERALFD